MFDVNREKCNYLSKLQIIWQSYGFALHYFHEFYQKVPKLINSYVLGGRFNKREDMFKKNGILFFFLVLLFGTLVKASGMCLI